MQGMHSEVLNILLSRGEWNGSEKPSGWVGGAWGQERERERLEKVPEQTTQGPGGSAGAVGQHHQRRWLPAGQGEGRCEQKKGPGTGEPRPDARTTFKPLGGKMRGCRDWWGEEEGDFKLFTQRRLLSTASGWVYLNRQFSVKISAIPSNKSLTDKAHAVVLLGVESALWH